MATASVTRSVDPRQGVSIAYQISPGPCADCSEWLVLVHGTLQSKAVWERFGYIDELTRHFNVVTIDVLGHGQSSKPHFSALYDTTFLALDICAVLDDIAIQSAHYIGYSLGGRIGLAMAMLHPERIRSLVVVGSSHYPQHDLVDRFFCRGAIEILETDGMRAFVAQWQEAHDFVLSAKSLDRLAGHDPLALAAYLRSCQSESGIDQHQLSAIKIPTLICVGTDDTFRFDESVELAKLIPGAEFYALAGKDHGQTITAGAPELLAQLTMFFGARYADVEATGWAA
ncbi:alpha/beta fold hydrolase [Mycobacterium sp. Aquia_213]|uniref:alpha/beta fold hydrolase n=1 Tax=Mycobacterium sp. Aquia_213 TaxID=2991728 RepID=UPI002271E28D|nr:alpha/beta fold hydrolase [Mycobacterium sp. Aquia_213]WAC89659.1 alpha/beta fold hydrolase [Mycobacterium sp. Aquia_213]